MTSTLVIVQASSRSWQGGSDLCMNEVDGVPVVVRTVKRFFDLSPDIHIAIAAPEFDKGGVFETLFDKFPKDRLSLTFVADASPLERLVEASAHLDEGDHFIRVDGLHFAALTDTVLEMLAFAKAGSYDCVKLPDDFPIQLTADIYRVGAVRKLLRDGVDGAFAVHPKYALFADPATFKTSFFDAPNVDDAYLQAARDTAETVYFIPRMEVNKKAIEAGNQLTFHYQLALDHLPEGGKVLDIACGDGYGSRLMAGKGYQVLGGDIDPGIVKTAQASLGPGIDASFRQLDVTALDLPDESFDAAVSMETIEHVDDHAYMRELRRVLRPGGRLILSTPQNALGHIPVNAEHVREYSLTELENLCSEYFRIDQVVGIKQGRIILPDSPLGANVLLVCTKQ